MWTVDYVNFIDSLKQRLSGKLPGSYSHGKMSPPHRLATPDLKPEMQDYRLAAVLALIIPDTEKGGPRIVLIERSGGADVHANQIGFPGGKKEEGEDLAGTSLRETFEEIGIPPHKINVLGALTPLYIPPSRFFVHPFMGVMSEVPAFNLNQAEVKKVITPFLHELLDSNNLRAGSFRNASGITVEAPCFYIGDTLVWGATAMMLSEIRELLTTLKQDM